MNQDKKTSSFLKAINKYAQQQSDQIKHEVEEFKKQEIEKATKEGISDAYKLIQKEISIKKAQIVSDIAKREQESRKQLFIKRNEIVENVFCDVIKHLGEFTKTQAYIDYIRKSAEEIAELFDGNKCIIYIREADNDKTDIIRAILDNCDITIDNTIEIGGIKGYCEELSLLSDDTFDSKIENEREWFAENSGLKVV